MGKFVLLFTLFIGVLSKDIRFPSKWTKDEISHKKLISDMKHPLNEYDFERAQLLTAEDLFPITTTDKDMYDDDIKLTKGTKNAIIDPSKKWPSGRVPYVISSDYDEHDRAIIAKAIQEYHDKTCIRFTPRTAEDKNYVYLYPQSGCSSYIGQIGGQQVISLAKPGCVHAGIIMHEFMHAIGFRHEQSRTDRDDHVIINWDQIQSGREHNFNKYEQDVIQDLGVSYDYNSILHYGPNSFAIADKPTIVTLDPEAEIGQRVTFSQKDLLKINKLYECGISEGINCQHDQSMLLNQADCSTFYICSNGEPHLFNCPAGLKWNDFIKACDWPSERTCVKAPDQ